jgi:hypothetical protein
VINKVVPDHLVIKYQHWKPDSHSADVINLEPAANGKSGVKSWLLFVSPNCPAK